MNASPIPATNFAMPMRWLNLLRFQRCRRAKHQDLPHGELAQAEILASRGYGAPAALMARILLEKKLRLIGRAMGMNSRRASISDILMRLRLDQMLATTDQQHLKRLARKLNRVAHGTDCSPERARALLDETGKAFEILDSSPRISEALTRE